MKPKAILKLAPGVKSPEPRMPEPQVAFAECKAHRDLVSTRYDEAINFAYPGRRGLTSGPDAAEAYDDTAVVAAPEFASRIQAGVTPNYARWASHMVGMFIDDEDEKKDMQADLQIVDEFLFEMINASNFPVEVNECYQDLAVGTMCMIVEEGDEQNPIRCEAMPLSELYFSAGPDGRPDPISRSRMLNKRQIQVLYPDATNLDDLEDDNKAMIEVVEICQRDWDAPSAWKYRYSVFLPTKNNRVIWRYDAIGKGSCKFILTRWSKASGEIWGRGPLMTCLPSMRICNFGMKTLIDHAEISLAGIWSVEDDGVINTETVKLEPGILVPRAPGSQPLQNVAPAGNFDISQFLIEEHRNNIKKALFTEQLGNPNKTPMTATEVDQRMAELSRAIGAPFGRIVYEFVMPFITRTLRILKDKGMIALPEVDGREIKATVTSPLARTQDFEDIDRTVKYVGTVGQLFGPETAALTVDATETSLYLANKFGVPERLSRSRKDQKALSAQIARAAQGGMGGEEDQGAGPAQIPGA